LFGDKETEIGELYILREEGKVTVIKCVHLGVRNNILKIPLPTSCANALCLPKCPKNQFFANISLSIRSRGIVGLENVPREISYKIDHSGISLGLPISLKIYSNKYKLRFLLFFMFLITFLEISRDL